MPFDEKEFEEKYIKKYEDLFYKSYLRYVRKENDISQLTIKSEPKLGNDPVATLAFKKEYVSYILEGAKRAVKMMEHHITENYDNRIDKLKEIENVVPLPIEKGLSISERLEGSIHLMRREQLKSQKKKPKKKKSDNNKES
jgi:hypothetical protein